MTFRILWSPSGQTVTLEPGRPNSYFGARAAKQLLWIPGCQTVTLEPGRPNSYSDARAGHTITLELGLATQLLWSSGWPLNYSPPEKYDTLCKIYGYEKIVIKTISHYIRPSLHYYIISHYIRPSLHHYIISHYIRPVYGNSR